MILDTNAVSALLVGDPAIAQVLSAAPKHELPVVVIGEYRYGLLQSKRRKELEPLLDGLVSESTVLRVDERTAAAYALVRQGLRQRGTPIPENDVWIAALAHQYQQPVVSRDEHFDYVDGLERVAW